MTVALARALPLAAALCLAAASLPAWAQTEDAPAQVIVEGRRPGPGVWKVSQGEHVMWIFGVYSPLPKKMEWDDARVERLVKGAQEVLLEPHTGVVIKSFGSALRTLVALPRLIGIEKNPDGATLRDVLPADTYAHWAQLKAKYIGADEDVERLRPMFAAERLLRAALEKNGLTGGDEIYIRIDQIVKANKVRQTPTGLRVDLDDPGGMIKDFKQSRIADLACLVKTLDGLEGDIAAMRVRANAWANGDIAAIQTLDFAESGAACRDAKLNNAMMKKALGVEDVTARLRASWLEAAEHALASNTSTFATLQMKDMLGPDGVLAALQAKG
jgi:hypothetical protein